MKKRLFLAGMFGAVFVAALVLTGCPGTGDNGVTNAAVPTITGHPTGADIYVGEAAPELSVTATVGDGGTLSYRWFAAESATGAGTAIADATGAAFTPDVSEVGITYYYVVVTNTNTAVSGTQTASATSNRARVEVKLGADAQEPVISVQPESHELLLGDAAPELSVTATVGDGGTLSYQWFQADDATGAGVAVANATGAAFTPDVSEIGIAYYYVVVTNTNTAVSGTETATATSDRARVEVSPAPIVERIYIENAAYALFQFELPAGTTWGDFDSLSAQFKVDAENMERGVRHWRLMGAYAVEDFAAATGSINLSSANRHSSGDNNGPFIMDNQGRSFSDFDAVADEWFTVTYDISGASGHGAFDDANAMPDAAATWPFVFGIGIAANAAGPTDGITQYVRLVTLHHSSDPALSVVGTAMSGFASFFPVLSTREIVEQ